MWMYFTIADTIRHHRSATIFIERIGMVPNMVEPIVSSMGTAVSRTVVHMRAIMVMVMMMAVMVMMTCYL